MAKPAPIESKIYCDYKIKGSADKPKLEFRQRKTKKSDEELSQERDSISFATLHGYALGVLLNDEALKSGISEIGIKHFWDGFLSAFSKPSGCSERLIVSLRNLLRAYFNRNGERNGRAIKSLSGSRKWRTLEKIFKGNRKGLSPIIKSIRERKASKPLHQHFWIQGQDISNKWIDRKADLLEAIRNLAKGYSG